MTIEDLMRSRATVRKFKEAKPDRETIRRLIDVAVTAPSASNHQPWRFFATDDAALIARMAEAVQGSVDRIAEHIEPNSLDAFKSYGAYFVRFREAPVLLAVLYKESVVLSHLVDDRLSASDADDIRSMENRSGLVSTSLAVQNLMLYAHSIGLGTSCMTGPLVAASKIKELLGVPPPWEVACLVTVGYPDESPSPRPRKSPEAVMRWIEGGSERSFS